LDHISGSSVTLNHSHGIDLEQPGNGRVENTVVSQNLGDGIHVVNNTGTMVVGNTDLSQSKGNIASGNAGSGIFAQGNVIVAGNVAFGQAGFLQAGVYLFNGAGATAIGNVVFDNYDGVFSNFAGAVTNNRAYHNSNAGIDVNSGAAVGNIAYSNTFGI